MKIIYNIMKAGLILSILFLMACEDDFLDRSIKIRRTYEDIVGQGPGNLQANGMASYRYLRQWTTLGGNAMLASACDESDFANNAAPIQRFNTGGWNQFSNPDEVMAWYYRGIVQTHEFLKNSENFKQIALVDTSTLQTKADYIKNCDNLLKLRGENHFLRAWFYFELVKRYGGVPILETSLDINETNMPPRNTVDECVNYILAECDTALKYVVDHWVNYGMPLGANDAIGNGRGTVAGSNDVTNLGRAEKVTVKALKQRVLLYAASPLYNPTNDVTKWEAAAAAGQDFLTDPELVWWRYLWNNYVTLFNMQDQQLLTSRKGKNSGVIFTLNFGAGFGSSIFERWNYPVGIPNGGTNVTAPSQNLVDAFEMQATGLAIETPGSGYNPADPYTGRDPRLKMIVGVNGDIYGKAPGGANRPIQSYVGGEDAIGVKQGATTTGYYLKKMARTDFDLSTATVTNKVFVAMRYAEVLLNFAEAMNEAYGPEAKPAINGQTAFYSALEAVNLVRARAGVAMPPLPAGLSKEEFRERLRNERRVELAFEEHRFFDVRRWKIAEVTENMPLMGIRVTPADPPLNTTFNYEKFEVEKRVFDASKMYLYPIPEAQVIINGWNQNPGWN
jgi:starch-binding outer membrane protein, SusD/RagB family